MDRTTAQDHLKSAVRDFLAPAARAHGFRGSMPTWRKGTSEGDWAIVNLQSSPWSSASEVRCVLNVAVAPRGWIDWLATMSGAPKKALPSESSGLYRSRVHPQETPPGRDAWWAVKDEESARSTAMDIADQMAKGVWENLERLLDREALLAQVRAVGDLGDFKIIDQPILFKRAEAILLLDLGRPEEAAVALDELRALAPPGGRHDGNSKFEAWILSQFR
jgi:hypothetical protein